MKTILILIPLVALLAPGCQSRVIEPREREIVSKVFNYEGTLPIKDDRTGEIIRDDSDDDLIPTLDTSQSSTNKTVDEAACWKLIVDQSAVTFALQNRVIDELLEDIKDLPMESQLKDVVLRLANGMKSSMKQALEALDSESPQEYFDSLFETSENIVYLSSIIRNPRLDETVFLILVKAVSRLGRNNSALVQDFVDNCTIIERSQPRPRGFNY